MAIAASAIPLAIKRDRVVILTAIAALTAVAWLYMAHEARKMIHTGVCECFGMKMAGPDATSWSAVELISLFLMWSEMMVAMMLPTAAPMLLVFASVNRRRLEQDRPFVATGIFAAG